MTKHRNPKKLFRENGSFLCHQRKGTNSKTTFLFLNFVIYLSIYAFIDFHLSEQLHCSSSTFCFSVQAKWGFRELNNLFFLWDILAHWAAVSWHTQCLCVWLFCPSRWPHGIYEGRVVNLQGYINTRLSITALAQYSSHANTPLHMPNMMPLSERLHTSHLLYHMTWVSQDFQPLFRCSFSSTDNK